MNKPEDNDAVEEVSPIPSHNKMRIRQLRQSLASYQKGDDPHVLTCPHGRNLFIPDPDTLDERQLMAIFAFLDKRDQPVSSTPHIIPYSKAAPGTNNPFVANNPSTQAPNLPRKL